MMNKIKSNIIFAFALLILISKAYAKPIPPGSGEGDVPANILFLLDSSKSMNATMTGGTYLGLSGVDWVVELSDGNVVVAEKGSGLVKILVGDNKIDTTWANNNKRFRGTDNDSNCQSGTGTKKSRINTSSSGDIASDGSIWVASAGFSTIVGVDSTGKCVGVIPKSWHAQAQPRFIEIRQNSSGENILFAVGHTHQNKQKKGYLYVHNLGKNPGTSFNTGSTYRKLCEKNRPKDNVGPTIDKERSQSFSISKDLNFMHFVRKGNLWSFKLEDVAGYNGIKCPKTQPHVTIGYNNTIKAYNYGSGKHEDVGTVTQTAGSLNKMSSVRASSDDDSVVYLTSETSSTLQKLTISYSDDSNDGTYPTAEVLVTAGTLGTKTSGNPGTVNANAIKFDKPGISPSNGKIAQNLFANSSNIYVTSKSGAIQKLDENKFNATDKDTSWQKQIGGSKTSRFTGAIEAIIDIVSDSSLQAGANFGFGDWNGGEKDVSNRKAYPGEVWCHKNEGCHYYGGWDPNTAHPLGTSKICNHHSCLRVAISTDGKTRIPAVIPRLYTKFATDANAFADLAYGYFTDEETGIIDKKKPCQIHYVILIGDGMMFNESRSIPQIKDLRQKHGVRTIVIAYGGAYKKPQAKAIFDRFAKAGSCDTDGHIDCMKTEEADNAVDLKTVLEQKIRQVIADRLSFSAPTITANLQEGGAIYQAQFNYTQNGDWTGKLLRKAIGKDDKKLHQEMSYCDDNGCNWDAGQKLLEKTAENRKIWTALDTGSGGATYHGNWNNWDVINKNKINGLFEATGNRVIDYHNTSSTCSQEPGVADGYDDDISGLINFVRGEDYFDYNGGCNITEDRDSILADIYHSQLIEVGPPNANTAFTSNNQEAYWRASQGYAQFKRDKSDRIRIVYAGSNGGMLHAFRADTGEEEWAFIPPMIASQLPLLMNKGYEGNLRVNGQVAGGSNAIFGVDGSPVVHDAKIFGLSAVGDGYEYDTVKTWRTLLFVTYGRGGAGFSVLDVTNPEIITTAVDDTGMQLTDEDGSVKIGGQGPIHMFSIYNDTYNDQVIRVDHNGAIQRFDYIRAAKTLKQSEEGQTAINNQMKARSDDSDSDTDFTNRDDIKSCESDSDYPSTNFRTSGTNACYKGKTFTFDDIELPDAAIENNGDVIQGKLIISELISDDWYPLPYGDGKDVKATYKNNKLTVTFSADKVINEGIDTTYTSDAIKIVTSCDGAGTKNPKFDYSELGETWSNARILRIPDVAAGNIMTDTYVAVLGGGYGSSASPCSGSGVYIVDLEGGSVSTTGTDGSGTQEDDSLIHEAGRLYGSSVLKGPLKILDSDPDGDKLGIGGDDDEYDKGSPIKNSIPATPVLITADTVKNVPWRGGLVYINDMEGKITKINLTNDGKMFEQQTLMNLEADLTNKRKSFFEMDAAIGTSTGNFWLFGGTGDFNRVSEIDDEFSWMDNIVYGIRDRDFPYFISNNTFPVPLSGEDNFISAAATALQNAPTITQSGLCVDATGTSDPICDVTASDIAWRYHLGNADGEKTGKTQNMFRKVTGPATIYRGKVYFPIYQPDKENNCNLGQAFVCAHDDECGSLSTKHIDGVEGTCYEVGTGILSKLVVFGGRLFANLAGPSVDSETLVEILASDKQLRSYRKSWRENY